MRESYACGLMTCINLSGGSRAPFLPPLFLDQTETRRAEKHFFNPPALSQGLDDRPPLLSDGLDPPLDLTHQGQFLTPDSQIWTNCS